MIPVPALYTKDYMYIYDQIYDGEYDRLMALPTSTDELGITAKVKSYKQDSIERQAKLEQAITRQHLI